MYSSESCFLLPNFQTVEILEELVEKGSENMDVRNKDQAVARMKAAVASKQFGQEDVLCSLIADVIISCLLLFVIDQLFYLGILADSSDCTNFILFFISGGCVW
jgi:hypothetical protein